MLNPSSVSSLSHALHLLPAQTTHRLNLLNIFSLPSNAQILEVGCGQGDFTAILASILSPTGHIDALDPAPLTYGAPITLGEAQAFLSSTSVGDGITWHQTNPITYLSSLSPEKPLYDSIIFCHSLWYFASRTEIQATFTAARTKAKRLLLAEWSLSSFLPSAFSHILAAMTTAVRKAHVRESQANIRCLVTPEGIKNCAVEAGWRLGTEEMLVPERELQDASWEVGMVADEGFLKEADGERVEDLLREMRRGVLEAVRRGAGEDMRCMDVWVAEFV